MESLHSGPMTTETAAPQRPQRRPAPQTLAAIVVAVVIGGLGGAAIYAATEGQSHTIGGGTHGMGAGTRGTGDQMHGPPPAPGGPPSARAQPDPNAPLHSEYVVPDGNGGYTTKLTQTGTVDEVTLSSVVVRSDDGYTQIYALPPGAAGTNSTLAPNDTVTVAATRTGSTVTLTSIGNGPPHEN